MVPILTPSSDSRSLPSAEAWKACTSTSPCVPFSTMALKISTALTVRLSGLFGPALESLITTLADAWFAR